MKKSTYTIAYEACQKLFSESGRIPTIEAIKQIININSPNTISSAIKDWKKTLPTSIKSSVKSSADFPPSLLNTLSALWQQALLEANNNVYQQLEEIQLKQATLESKESELFDEKIRIQHLAHLTEQKYQDEIAILKKEIEQLTIESKKNIEQTEHFRTLIHDYEKNNVLLLEQLNQEREKFNRLESQYNREHDWSLKRIEEEKNIYKQSLQNELEQLKSEVRRNKNNKELTQAKLDSVSKQADEYLERILELERNLAGEIHNSSKLE